jgi:hypothetical protein
LSLTEHASENTFRTEEFSINMPTYYHIRLKGHLDDHWSAWFEDMVISNEAHGEAVLYGPLADQAALHGVLIKIRDLGLPLLAVSTVATNESPNDAH